MPITKQTIAIIGAESTMGSALAKSIPDGNYRLLLISKDITHVKSLAEEIRSAHTPADVDVMDCQYDACWEADIIILAVPYHSRKEVAQIIEEVAIQKVVVSIDHPTYSIDEGSATSSETATDERLQEWLPHSKIVTVFNTDLKQPMISEKQADAFIAGDNETALEMVSELIRTAGFVPIITKQSALSH